MTTFRTMNPIGSKSPKDLSDNAENLDYLMLGPLSEYEDRRGVSRLSWKGIELAFQDAQAQRAAAFQEFLEGSGWSSLGAYGAGVVITSHTQTVDYLGQPYSLKSSIPASLDAPYVTTGVWATEGVNFKLVGDNALRQDLAAPGGSDLSGWARGTLKPASTVGQVLALQPVNLLEKVFSDLVTDRPDVNDMGTWDWAPALQAANNQIRSRFNAYGPGVQNVIDIPGGRYRIKSQVVISAFVKLRCLGEVVFETYVAGGSAFWFTPSVGDYSNNTAVLTKQQWFRGAFINGAAGGISFSNRLPRVGCTGIEIGPRSDLGALIPFARYTSCDYSVEGYAVGIKFNRFRNYIGHFSAVHVENNTENVVFGDEAGGNVVDSGENITFDELCTFATAETGFRWYCDGFDVNLFGCSYDYMGTIFRTNRLYKKITVVGGHMEGIGGSMAHDGIGGIFLEESVNPSDAGTQMTVSVTGVSAFVAPGPMFRGSNRVQLEVDIEYRKMGTNNTPDKMFLVDPQINLRRKSIVMQQRATFPSASVNVLRNPSFDLDSDAAPATTGTPPIGYSVVAGSLVGAVDAAGADPTIGGKALRLTGVATGSYYSLDSTDKHPCQPGDMVMANLFVRFPSDALASETGVTARIQFFSATDTVLLTSGETSNSMGSGGLTMGVYCAHAWARQACAPAGSAYYKVRFGVSGTAMNNKTTYITGLYSTILK